jgi:hypothetical protein
MFRSRGYFGMGVALLVLSVLVLPGCAGRTAEPKVATASQAKSAGPAYGTIKNLNDPNYKGLPRGIEIPNYHLYGYDVLNSGYIHTMDVKDHPILDATKLKAKLFTSSSDKGSDILYTYSSRMNSFYSKFNSSVDVKYKGVAFSGKISDEFNLEKQTSSTQTFIRYIQYHTLYKSAFTGETSDLQAMLTDQFKADAAAFQDDPQKLFAKYGTHLITKYYLGGRADLNFVFNNTSSSSDEDIRNSVSAAYGRISGDGSADNVTKSKLVLDNSTLTLKTYGGDFISGDTVDALAKQFPDWTKSIQGSPNICRLGNFDESMLPVWQLMTDAKVAAKYEAEFNREAAGRQIDLDGLVDIPPAPQTYITDIVVLDAGSDQAAQHKLPAGYTPVYQAPGSDRTDWLDCNHNAGGDFIYIAYKTGPDKANAITDIYTATGKSTSFSGFTKIDQDLNRGAGGDFIYLFYRKATAADLANSKTSYLREIRGFYGKSNSLPSGWSWPGQYVDLNKGAKGSFVYVVVRKD